MKKITGSRDAAGLSISHQEKRRSVARSLALLAVVFGILSCSRGSTVEWKQEVQLHDGRVITVDRISKLTGKPFPENTVIEYEKSLIFTHPDTGERISWTLPGGTGSYLLDFDNGFPYAVLKPSSVADYNKWNCPNPPWIAFRYQQGEWARVDIGELPILFGSPNLLNGAAGDPKAVANGVYSIAAMHAHLKVVAPSYRVISREKVSPIAEGCFESVLIKQGRQSEIDNRR